MPKSSWMNPELPAKSSKAADAFAVDTKGRPLSIGAGALFSLFFGKRFPQTRRRHIIARQRRNRRDPRLARPMRGVPHARLLSNVVALQQRKKWPS